MNWTFDWGDPHHLLGLLALLGMGVQPVIGFIANAVFDPTRKQVSCTIITFLHPYRLRYFLVQICSLENLQLQTKFIGTSDLHHGLEL